MIPYLHNVIFKVNKFLESLDSFWIMRSQRSRHSDKGLLNALHAVRGGLHGVRGALHGVRGALHTVRSACLLLCPIRSAYLHTTKQTTAGG